MKKINKILSLVCAIALILGTINCSFKLVSLANSNIEPFSNTSSVHKFTFENSQDANDTLNSFAIAKTYEPNGKSNEDAIVSIVEDGEENHSLKVSTKSYIWTVLNFGIELKAGKEYKISYKVKKGNGAAVLERSGIYAAKDAETTTVSDSFDKYKFSDDVAALLGGGSVDDIVSRRLATLYKYTSLDAWNVDKSLSTSWTEYSVIVKPETINGDYKYFSLAIQLDPGDTTKYTELYFDDVEISEVTRSTVYVNGEPQDVTYPTDSEVELPIASVPGYNYEGLYSDISYSEQIGVKGQKIDWGSESKVYYEKWSLMTDAKYTFENPNNSEDSFRAFALPVAGDDGKSNKDATISIVDDKNGNHCLKVSTNKYIWAVINFDYEFAAGEDYEISYKIRRGENCAQDDKSSVLERSGIYAAADARTKTVEDSFKKYDSSTSSANLLGGGSLDEIVSRRLATLYKYTSLDAWNVDKGLGTDWITYTTTVSPETVDLERKYFSLAIQLDPGNVDRYNDIYIDDVTIRNINISTLKVYADSSVTFRTEKIGTKIDLPLSKGKYGYEFKGLYSDPQFNNLVAANQITWPDTDITYYEKWVKSTKAELPIGTKASFDFESADSGYLSYAFQNQKIDNAVSLANSSGGMALKVIADEQNPIIFNFNFELESFTKYRVTYSIKGDNCKVSQESKIGSGIYQSKKITVDSYSSNPNEFEALVGTKLAHLYNVNGKDSSVSSSAQNYVREITTGYVNDKNLLSLVVALKGPEENTALYLDNIVIEKIGIADSSVSKLNIAAYDFDNETNGYMNSFADNTDSTALLTEGALKLTASKKSAVAVNFDYILEDNATYAISYDIKSNADISLSEDSGIFVGTSLTNDKKTTVKSHLYKKGLLSFNDVTSSYTHIDTTFVTLNNSIIGDYKYLTFVLAATDDSTIEIYIDNLNIKKITSEINGHYSFEDSTNADDNVLDYAIENGQSEATVFVDTEFNGNKALKTSVKANKQVLINIPFKFTKSAKYRITYKIKGDAKLVQNDKTGIFLGKSTGTTTDETAFTDSIANYKGTKLSNIYGTSTGNGIALPQNWTEQSYTFSAPSNVTEYNLLTFVISQSKTGYADIFIDDIVIDRIYEVKFNFSRSTYKPSSIASIYDVVGTKYDMNYLNYAGYDIEGVYTDPRCTEEYDKDYFEVINKVQPYYVKYKKASESSKGSYVFSNESEILANNKKGFSISKDPLNSTNGALKLSGTADSFVTFDYELEKDKTYEVTFKYKASGELARLNLAIAAGSKDSSKIVETIYNESSKLNKEKTRQYNVFGSDKHEYSSYITLSTPEDGWLSKTLYFKANDTIDKTYKYLTITGNIPAITGASIDSTEVYIDDLSIREVEAKVNFKAEYEKNILDVQPLYGNIGDKITLPNSLINPFKVDGWYYDKELTKPVGNTLKIENKNTTLYAKVSKEDKTVLDFEDLSDVQFSYGKWLSAASNIATAVDDINNNVYLVKTRDWAFSDARLNYQLMPERVYRISLKYRAIGEGDYSSTLKGSFGPSYIPEENGYGIFSKKDRTMYHEDSSITFINGSSFPLDWTTQSFLVGTGTNGPQITDKIKYLALLMMDTSSSHVCFEIDDIIIEDLGVYDPSFFPVNSSSDWQIPEATLSDFDDWKNWTLSDISDDDMLDSWDDDFRFEEIDNPEENEKTEDKKVVKRKKKVVSYITDGFPWYLIVIICAVVVAATGTIVFLVIKRKRKKNTA